MRGRVYVHENKEEDYLKWVDSTKQAQNSKATTTKRK
jgi:hypothetical protein